MTDPTPEELRKEYRIVLNLGKYLVTEKHGDTIKVALGGTTTLTVRNSTVLRSSVAAGDAITLYTEIPYGR